LLFPHAVVSILRGPNWWCHERICRKPRDIELARARNHHALGRNAEVLKYHISSRIRSLGFRDLIHNSTAGSIHDPKARAIPLQPTQFEPAAEISATLERRVSPERRNGRHDPMHETNAAISCAQRAGSTGTECKTGLEFLPIINEILAAGSV
jgi:hypothetical protein